MLFVQRSVTEYEQLYLIFGSDIFSPVFKKKRYVLFLAESSAEAEHHIVIGKSELSSHPDSIVSINVFGLEYVKLH